MYPMLREGVELEQYEASEDPYADFPENLDAVHCYAENPDGDLFAIDADIFHALFPFRHPSLTMLLTNPTASRGGCVATHNPIGST